VSDEAGEPEVRAAGGLVIRDGEVLLVHRPAYDDWTIPKGKLEPGESWEAAALREVEEETGLSCELGELAGTTRYLDSRGRDKLVHYFLMSAAGEPEPRNEIDAVRFVSLAAAGELLSYERDRELVNRLR
jgi:8-oxo-dGTP diphosphatase